MSENKPVVVIIGESHQSRVAFQKTLAVFYELHFLVNLDDCVEEVKAKLPDVIICDAKSEHYDARDICMKLTSLVPFIFLSNIHREDEQRTCLLEAPNLYLTRPYKEAELIKFVEQQVNFVDDVSESV